MERSNNFDDELEIKNKTQKLRITPEKRLIKEETSLFSIADRNVVQFIFIYLVRGYERSIYYQEEDIEEAITLLVDFASTCKLFEDISKRNSFGLTLNNITIDLNYKKYLKILFIKKKVKQDDYFEKKNIHSIFYQSCALGYYTIINTLIKYGANINHIHGDDDWNPLIVATFRGNLKTTKKLIKQKKLEINQQDKGGNTGLIFSSWYGREDIVKILLSRKDIFINMRDNEGKTALNYAREKKNKNIIQILTNYQINF